MKNNIITTGKLLKELRRLYGDDINISISVPIVLEENLAERLNNCPSTMLLKGYLSAYQNQPELLRNMVKCKDIQIAIVRGKDENTKILAILNKKLNLFESLADGTRIVDNLVPKCNLTANHPNIVFEKSKNGDLYLSRAELSPLACDKNFARLDIDKLFKQNNPSV